MSRSLHRSISLLIFSGVIGTSSNALAQQESVHLQCKGTLSSSQDGEASSMQATVDVTMDLKNNVMEVDGWWGCLANIGIQMSPACRVFKIKANESDVEYFGHTDGDMYEGSTNMSLNRYSGNLRAFSVASAKPAANAKWKLMQITTELKCSAPAKLF